MSTCCCLDGLIIVDSSGLFCKDRVSRSRLWVCCSLCMTQRHNQRPYDGRDQANTIGCSTWLFGEAVGAVLLFLTIIEGIVAIQYDLQPYGRLVFQCCKSFLWTILTIVCIALLGSGWHSDDRSGIRIFIGLATPFVAVL